MYCIACGSYNDDSANYCKKCGKQLIEFSGSQHEDQPSRDVSMSKPKFQATDTTPNSNYSAPSSSNSTRNIANSRKGAGIALIICGLVIALIGGYVANELSDAAKPVTVRSGYMLNGQTVTTDTWNIGGNTEAVSVYNSLQYVFIIAGIVIVIGGVALFASGKKFESIPSMIKHGIIIDLDVLIATLEFDDGSRDRLQYRPSDIVFILGDTGNFEIKGGKIVSFIKD